MAASRFTVFPGSDADVIGAPDELRVEPSLPGAVRDELAALGHRIVVQPEFGAGGSAQLISVDERGVLAGAADPRQEGVAIGVE